jgi:hypothetical protein
MSTSKGRFAGLLAAGLVVFCLACGDKTEDRASGESTGKPSYTAADTLNWNVFVAYLQDHFDDLHDVTMRFHHRDETLNGILVLRMEWEEGRLRSAEVVSNETGSDELAEALIEKIRGWNIPDLQGPSEISLPVNVKLVGLDDPAFPDRAILTGEVTDTEGKPVSEAMVELKPPGGGVGLRAETNREGIFVRTLIPPGVWDLECSHSGFEPASGKQVALAAGRHGRVKLILEKM